MTEFQAFCTVLLPAPLWIGIGAAIDDWRSVAILGAFALVTTHAAAWMVSHLRVGGGK